MLIIAAGFVPARAVENATGWLLDRGYRNLLIEIANETAPNYHHAILCPGRIHELIHVAQAARANGFRFPVAVSMTGGALPTRQIVRASDFLLLHGNGVNYPAAIAAMVRRCRQVEGYHPMPILFNEDDHAPFARPSNHLLAAVREHASWGFLDQVKNNYADAGGGLYLVNSSSPAISAISPKVSAFTSLRK